MSFSHKKFDAQIREFLRRNIYYVLTFMFTVAVIIGGGLAYSFFSAQVESNKKEIKRLEEKIAEITKVNENQKKEIQQNQLLISGNSDYVNLIYKFYVEEKARAEINGDKEKQARLDKLINRLDRITDQIQEKK